MAILDKTYSIKLDVKNSITNTVPEYYISDNETSDILITIINGKNVVVLDNVIVLMVAISPDKERQYDFIDVRVAEEGLIYCNLKQQFKNVAGTWYSRLMLISNEEKLVTDTFSYNVESDDFVGMDDDALLDDRYPILTDMISRLSTLETTELSRVNAELGRVEAERQRELIKQQFITDVERLISDTNTNVNTTLTQNTQKVDTLVSTTTQKIDAYKLEKDAAIDTVFNQYKTTTTQDINTYKTSKDAEIDLYKTQKDSEIDQYKATKNSEIDQYKVQKDLAIDADLTSYKTTTTQDINTYKTTKDAEIDAYKTQKDSEINTYVESKTSEIDVYVETKNQVLDAAELSRQTSETARVEAEKLRVQQHTERETILNGYNDRLTSVETINETQNTRLAKVEYQNKVQDVFINGLFNENNNKRLTIEDEGNDIKLEGSVEGLATVDKIVGNTTVNYCLGGDRELTLNGDIDVSGNELTITEGVDGGKVDVVCEGNTLVNLIDLDNFITTGIHTGHTSKKLTNGYQFNIGTCLNTIYSAYKLSNNIFKLNTEYTIYFNVQGLTNNPTSEIGEYNFINPVNKNLGIISNGINKFKFTYTETTKNIVFSSFNSTTNPNISILNPIILEGDYTDKPIPTEYFEGLKSVGQNDTDGHGIEIVSRNKNLIDLTKLSPQSSRIDNFLIDPDIGKVSITYNKGDYPYMMYILDEQLVDFFRGKTLKIGYTVTEQNEGAHPHIQIYATSVSRPSGHWLTNNALIPEDVTMMRVQIYGSNTSTPELSGTTTYTDICIGVAENITFTPHASNSIKIPLSEPLRGLPNGVKDKPVKRDGKWYIERNCRERILDGSEDWVKYNKLTNTSIFAIKYFGKIHGNGLCDKVPYIINDSSDTFHCRLDGDGAFCVWVDETKNPTQDVTGLKQWLQENPVTVVYELAEPYYEPLDVTPELETYLETTHILNDSVIPCNMNVKNTGFNAIIKPSTLYTVITDKTGDGSINCNLGGTVATSSTNILTVTTPATLTENMLRLSGKGLTAKNVRLLEGDCTNLYYPYFEGLRSTFDNVLVTEEMVQQGLEKAENLGKYKCNVKVRGKNLLKNTNYENITINGVTGIITSNTTRLTSDFIKMPISKNITVFNDDKFKVAIRFYDVNKKYIYLKEFTDFINSKPNSIKTISNINAMFFRVIITKIDDTETIAVNDLLNNKMQIEEGTVATSYEPYYERTETVYLNSPLLKGDEIVVKEDGLYHYHKTNKVVLNGSESWNINSSQIGVNTLLFGFTLGFSLEYSCKPQSYLLSDAFVSNKGYESNWASDTESIYINTNKAIYFRINKLKLSTQDLTGFKQWLQANPVTVVYELAEPYYEKIADYPITLEIPTTASLSVDSELPCQSLKVTYTGNVPSLYHIEETNTKNTEYISDTQVAVDFILMNTIPMMTMNVDTKIGLTEKGVTNMGAYFASRIMRGFLEYSEVVARYPQFKEDIDFILKSEGQGDLITK